MDIKSWVASNVTNANNIHDQNKNTKNMNNTNNINDQTETGKKMMNITS